MYFIQVSKNTLLQIYKKEIYKTGNCKLVILTKSFQVVPMVDI